MIVFPEPVSSQNVGRRVDECRQRSRAFVHQAVRLFGVTRDEILGRSHRRTAKEARHWVWQQLRREGHTFPVIARVHGVHHATVHWACKKPDIEVPGERRPSTVQYHCRMAAQEKTT